MSWFTPGFERVKEEIERQEKGSEFGNNNESRFWVSVGMDRDVMFLDDFDWKSEHEGRDIEVVPFCFHEYKVDLNNHPDSWKNPVYITASRRCKPAEMNFKSNFVGALTILDVTPFKDKETGQEVVRPRKKIMLASKTALQILELKKQRKGNLRGWIYSVTRHEQTDPRVGSDFEPKEKVEDVKAWLAEKGCEDLDVKPYGLNGDDALEFYRELFKPMSYEQQESIFSSGNVVDGNVFRGKSGSGGKSSSKSSGNDVIDY